MSMNIRSGKKRGLTPAHKHTNRLGADMGQGTGAAGGFKYETLSQSMGQGGGRRKCKIVKLGTSMNQGS